MTTREPARPTSSSDILSVRDVCETLGIGLTTLYRWRDDGLFPSPIRIGPRRVGYTRGMIEAWIAARPTVGAS